MVQAAKPLKQHRLERSKVEEELHKAQCGWVLVQEHR